METAAAMLDKDMIEIDTSALNQGLSDRAASYRLFSRLFLKPLTAEEIESLAAMNLEKNLENLSDANLLAEGLNDMGRGLHRRHTGTVRQLSTDYTMAFDGVRSHNGLVATPYASVFAGSITGEKAVLYQEPRARDLHAYRSERIHVDPSLHLPEDHISFELSFMADLSDKIGAAFTDDNSQEALRLIDSSLDFLHNDILNWYKPFYELSLNLIETRFYRGVLKATFGYLLNDVVVLQDLREALAS